MFSTFLPNVEYNCTQRWVHFIYRAFCSFDKEQEFLEISRNRKLEIEDFKTFNAFRKKIKDISILEKDISPMLFDTDTSGYDLPF